MTYIILCINLILILNNMENYIILEMIGEGAFGKVYKGQRKTTNQIVAIKKIIKK